MRIPYIGSDKAKWFLRLKHLHIQCTPTSTTDIGHILIRNSVISEYTPKKKRNTDVALLFKTFNVILSDVKTQAEVTAAPPQLPSV